MAELAQVGRPSRPDAGVSSDVLRAICAANGPMRCEIVVLPSQDCFDTDAQGNAFVGRVVFGLLLLALA
jgi:hypothetical protein